MSETYNPSDMATAVASMVLAGGAAPTQPTYNGTVFLQHPTSESWKAHSTIMDFHAEDEAVVHAQFHVAQNPGGILQVHSIVEDCASPSHKTWAGKKEHWLGVCVMKGGSPELPLFRWVAAFVDALPFGNEDEFISFDRSLTSDEITLKWHHLALTVRPATRGDYEHWELSMPHYEAGEGNVSDFMSVGVDKELGVIKSLFSFSGAQPISF
jgi:hypothetical protein